MISKMMTRNYIAISMIDACLHGVTYLLMSQSFYLTSIIGSGSVRTTLLLPALYWVASLQWHVLTAFVGYFQTHEIYHVLSHEFLSCAVALCVHGRWNLSSSRIRFKTQLRIIQICITHETSWLGRTFQTMLYPSNPLCDSPRCI